MIGANEFTRIHVILNAALHLEKMTKNQNIPMLAPAKLFGSGLAPVFASRKEKYFN